MSNTQKSWKGAPTTNLVDPSWAAWSIDGSGQGSIGTRTITDTYECTIVDSTANTRQNIYITSGISASTVYTFSVQYKKLYGTPTLRFQIQAYNGGTYLSTMSFATTAQLGITDIGDWQTAQITLTTPASTNRILWFMQDGDDYTTYTHSFSLKNVQCEQRSFATPFVAGTRSTAQALLDLTNKNTITASSLTYASSNTFSFSGSNYLTLPASVGAFGTGNFTINCWWKSSGTQSNYVAIMEQGFTGSPSNGAWAFKITHNTSIINFTYYNGGIVDNLSSFNINDGAWHNYVAVRSGTNLTLYVDSVSQYSLTLPGSYSFGEGSSVFVGYNPRDGTYINGSLPILSVYNRALPAAEIQQNFNALRTRYGI
jgi:hypothetical protein